MSARQRPWKRDFNCRNSQGQCRTEQTKLKVLHHNDLGCFATPVGTATKRGGCRGMGRIVQEEPLTTPFDAQGYAGTREVHVIVQAPAVSGAVAM